MALKRADYKRQEARSVEYEAPTASTLPYAPVTYEEALDHFDYLYNRSLGRRRWDYELVKFLGTRPIPRVDYDWGDSEGDGEPALVFVVKLTGSKPKYIGGYHEAWLWRPHSCPQCEYNEPEPTRCSHVIRRESPVDDPVELFALLARE